MRVIVREGARLGAIGCRWVLAGASNQHRGARDVRVGGPGGIKGFSGALGGLCRCLF